MKKTLKKLKAETNRTLKEYFKVTEELRQAEKPNGSAELVYIHMNSRQASLMITSNKAIRSLIDYVDTLKDYTLELEKTFDTLLKPKKQAKPKEKQEEAEKTSYIK